MKFVSVSMYTLICNHISPQYKNKLYYVFINRLTKIRYLFLFAHRLHSTLHSKSKWPMFHILPCYFFYFRQFYVLTRVNTECKVKKSFKISRNCKSKYRQHNDQTKNEKTNNRHHKPYYKTEVNSKCSWTVHSPCLTIATRRDTPVKNAVTTHERGKGGVWLRMMELIRGHR